MTGTEWGSALRVVEREMGHQFVSTTMGLECARCDLNLDRFGPGYYSRDALVKIIDLGLCRKPLGEVTWFEYRRPTIRELLEGKRR